MYVPCILIWHSKANDKFKIQNRIFYYLLCDSNIAYDIVEIFSKIEEANNACASWSLFIHA